MLVSLIRSSNERLQLASTDRLVKDHPCRSNVPSGARLLDRLEGQNHADKPDGVSAFVNDRCSARARRPIGAHRARMAQHTILLLRQFGQAVHNAGRLPLPSDRWQKDAVARARILAEWQGLVLPVALTRKIQTSEALFAAISATG